MININSFYPDYYTDTARVLQIAFTHYKPINLIEGALKYNLSVTPTRQKSIGEIYNKLLNGSRVALKYVLKDETFAVAKGFIFQYIETEEDIEFKPMIALCERKGQYYLLVNKDIQNNNLKPLIKKFVIPMMNYYDVIWTNNMNKYFCDLDLPNFKSLKEKKEFMNILVEEFQELTFKELIN